MKKNNAGWFGFINLCFHVKNIEELDQLLSMFLTIEEQESLGARYNIIEELLKGDLTQRKISEKHHVSIAQITRGSNALKVIDPKLKKFLENKLKIKGE